MTSENYRQLLNAERDSLEIEDFDNTLMHFAMLYHKEQLILSGASISSLAEKAKEEEILNREKMITNYNAPLDEIQPYENKHLLALIDEILKELNES